MSGLQSFMEKYPNVYYKINMGTEVENYRKAMKKNPILVVDGSCSRSIFGEDIKKNCLTGGQFKLYKRKANKFIDYFAKLDVDLVVYFDGCKVDYMRDRWIARKQDDIKKSHRIMDSLQNDQEIDDYDIVMPANIAQVIRSCFQKRCHVELSTFAECDCEIISYANRHKALAIFSQDADFAVAQGDFKYWSFKDINYDTNSTFVYDRQELAKLLNLQVKQLPMFRTMIGNDYILKSTLSEWFKQLGIRRTRMNEFNSHEKIIKVAKYIKNYDNSIESYKRLSMIVFGSIDKYSDIKTSVDTCFGLAPETITNLSDDMKWNDILLEVVDLMQAPHFTLSTVVFDIMHKQNFELNMIYEDFRKSDIPPSGIVWRDIRARIYGILLQDYPFDKTVKEWICTGGDISKPTDIKAVKPTIDLKNYKLQDFWNEDKDSDLIDISWKLFCSTINEKLPVERVQSFDKRCLVPVLILLHMIKKCQMKEDEIDAFLMMSVLCNTKDDVTEFSESYRNQINTRLLRLSTVFLRGISTICLVLESIGFIIPKENLSEWNIFDGALLQHLYRAPMSACNLDYQARRMFEESKNFMDALKEIF